MLPNILRHSPVLNWFFPDNQPKPSRYRISAPARTAKTKDVFLLDSTLLAIAAIAAKKAI